jgi:hypothetical protein
LASIDIVDEDGVRDDGEMRSMFTPDNGHGLASAVQNGVLLFDARATERLLRI